MIFGAFREPAFAEGALSRLADRGFKPGGFVVIGPQTQRGDSGSSEPAGWLGELSSKMTHAPTLSVDGREVACAGALPPRFDLGSDREMGGLRASFVNVGVSSERAAAFEDTVREAGLIVGVAVEDTERGREAHELFEASGARDTTQVDVAGA